MQTDIDSPNYYVSPSRTQAVLTSLIPIPFGNRIFYDGINNSGVEGLICVAEGIALSVGVMAGLTLVLHRKNRVFGKIVLGLTGGLIGNFTGFIIGGHVAGWMVAMISGGNDENQIGQLIGGITGLIGAIAGGVLGVNLISKSLNIETTRRVMYYAFAAAYLFNILDATIFDIDQKTLSKNVSLQIAPTYDVANNGLGMGVSLKF